MLDGAQETRVAKLLVKNTFVQDVDDESECSTPKKGPRRHPRGSVTSPYFGPAGQMSPVVPVASGYSGQTTGWYGLDDHATPAPPVVGGSGRENSGSGDNTPQDPTEFTLEEAAITRAEDSSDDEEVNPLSEEVKARTLAERNREEGIRRQRWGSVSPVPASPVPLSTWRIPSTPEREVKPLDHFSAGPLPSFPSWGHMTTWTPNSNAESFVPMGLLQSFVQVPPISFPAAPCSTPPPSSAVIMTPLMPAARLAKDLAVMRPAGPGAAVTVPRSAQAPPSRSTAPSPPGAASPGKLVDLSAFGLNGFIFDITVRRADGVPLGLEVELARNSRFLKVVAISKDGAIEAWNKQCRERQGGSPWKAVEPGDLIGKANDEVGCENMLREMKTKMLLKISIVREVSSSPSAPTPSAPQHLKVPLGVGHHAWQVMGSQLGIVGMDR